MKENEKKRQALAIALWDMDDVSSFYAHAAGDCQMCCLPGGNVLSAVFKDSVQCSSDVGAEKRWPTCSHWHPVRAQFGLDTAMHQEDREQHRKAHH